jgi:hypothetical protein
MYSRIRCFWIDAGETIKRRLVIHSLDAAPIAPDGGVNGWANPQAIEQLSCAANSSLSLSAA